MRGDDRKQAELFSYGTLEERIAADHPLRRMRTITDGALARLNRRFDDLYGDCGRPSIAPERLLRAMLIGVLYSIRSERALMDHIDLHAGFRWFVGLTLSEPVWDASTFSKNRERLLEGDVAAEFLSAVLAEARSRHLLSDDRFTVDGTLVEAWASLRSYQERENPPGPGAGSGRRGEVQKRDRFVSRTDADAFLYRKNVRDTSALRYIGHVLRDAKHGLIAGACATRATTRAEREAAMEMIEGLAVRRRRIRVAADKGYDERDFVQRLRELGVTPQVTQYTGQRRSSIDRRTTRHDGYREAQRGRSRIESIFSWLKNVGGQHRTRYRGRERVSWAFTFAAAAYNLMRMDRLGRAMA